MQVSGPTAPRTLAGRYAYAALRPETINGLLSICGQYQQSFRICIQPADSVYPLRKVKIQVAQHTHRIGADELG